MKIAWIFPQKERCGIATYSRRYAESLSGKAEVILLDPERFSGDREALLSAINGCDIAHVQYETSFFSRAGRDFFPAFCRAIHPPVVVSLHEVYRNVPYVYPRKAIRGRGPLAFARRTLYDRRHPLQTAYQRHLEHSFHSAAVLVHYAFQRSIIIEQGCRPEAIFVIPLPVPLLPGAAPPAPWNGDRPLSLAAPGFINPDFDYDLLFAALERLAVPWRFTWIGGIRRNEDAPLLQTVRAKIAEKRWNDRFTVTGWVSERDFRDLLCGADLICAFFSARSSSSSLTEALGALRPVIATPIPLTEELSRSGVVHLSPADPARLAEGIGELSAREDLRSS
ncbi:MAG: glycosyltransferase, partial [Chitinispirillaceae bacterium]|nr:glycosyltransferase [Chitinispirillaceae bacterium]